MGLQLGLLARVQFAELCQELILGFDIVLIADRRLDRANIKALLGAVKAHALGALVRINHINFFAF